MNRSILHPGEATGSESEEAPSFFADLNLDRIVAAITAGKEEYDLKPFFHAPLRALETILYRQEVMRDLERDDLFARVTSFAARMRQMRAALERARKLHDRRQKQWWFLDAVIVYCGAVETLLANLDEMPPGSRGLRDLHAWLAEYAASADFIALARGTRRIRAALAEIEYSLLIRDGSVSLRKYEGEIDYSASVEETFRKFAQGEGKDYRAKFPEAAEMNHVEAAALEFVARLHPEIFADLERFATEQAGFLDATVRAFDREAQFYVSYLDYIRKAKEAGLPFCYPRLAVTDKEISARESFDLALAQKLLAAGRRVVCNDFALRGRERIIIVSGPNQGGKTTFARMFGQLHYLASLGCPVPGEEARLLLFDRLFTHFEREEKIEDLRSKFEDDLTRVHAILEHATARSLIVMNESFSTTTLKDAIFIGGEVMRRIIARDVACLFVTFVEELARLSDTTISMVSTIVPGDPTSRTYQVVRRPADGRAYAMAIAEKYRLTYEALKERVRA